MNKCYICGETISEERLEALNVLDTPANRRTCLIHAPNSKVAGIYMGASGISPMKFVDRVENVPFKLDQINEDDKESEFISTHPEILDNNSI